VIVVLRINSVKHEAQQLAYFAAFPSMDSSLLPGYWQITEKSRAARAAFSDHV
jgi:hypothetical protein